MSNKDMFAVRDTLAGAEFTGRVNDVFASLGSGQVKHDNKDIEEKHAEPDFVKQQMNRSLKSNARIQPEKDTSDFKKPRMISKPTREKFRQSKVPGWKKNPHGYTKYSLADVPEMNNSSNTAAAFDFLNSIRKEKNDEVPADLNQKVIFKKRCPKTSNSPDVVDDSTENDASPAQLKLKKTKKKARPIVSFNEDEEDE